MGRKITMTGRNVQYTEHRAANATPDRDREITMVGEEAVYHEYVYGPTVQESGCQQQEAAGDRYGEDRRVLVVAADEHTEPEVDVEELVVRLMPIFYNNEDDVRRFLKEIRGMMPEDVTDLVNTWVRDKRISNYGTSRKGVLWEILSEAGLYTRSRQNWNRRVF